MKNTSPCYTPQYPCVPHAWTNFLSYPPTFPEVLAGSFKWKQMYGCSCLLATVWECVSGVLRFCKKERVTKSPLLFCFLNNHTLLAVAEEHICTPLNVSSFRQLNCVSATTQLLTPRELHNITTTDIAVIGGMDYHIPSLQPPTQSCTHSHACRNIHRVNSELVSRGLRGALQTDERWCVSTCKAEGSGNQLLLSTSDSCPSPHPAATLRRKLALWPARAQEWAGQHAAYAHCGDVWTPPRRSHPSHAGEGSGSGEWCRGSPKGCGFPDLGFLSSEAAHTASPATVGSAQLIHWAPRNQMWVEGQLDLKLCAASFTGLISHRTPPTLSCPLVSTNSWYIFPASWRNRCIQQCLKGTRKHSNLPPVIIIPCLKCSDRNIFPTENQSRNKGASPLPFQSPFISSSEQEKRRHNPRDLLTTLMLRVAAAGPEVQPLLKRFRRYYQVKTFDVLSLCCIDSPSFENH